MSSHELRAILFSDIVGFSGKMSVDEAATMRMVKRNAQRHTRVVKQFGGDVVDSMGDGFLCVFASSRQAVLAGLALQEDLRSADETTELRVGVHVGDTIIERKRSRIDDVFGDAVNIAARIESNAPAPGVWVSGRVAADLRNHPDFKLSSAGMFNLKNIPEPMEIFQVLTDLELLETVVSPAEESKKRLAIFRPLSLVVTALLIVASVIAYALSSDEPETLAVLAPLYLAEGEETSHIPGLIQDRLIASLSEQSGLRVISQASARRLSTTDQRLRDEEIDFFIEGSLSQTSESYQLTMRFIEADSERQLYSVSLDESLSDIDTLIESTEATFNDFVTTRFR